MDPGRITQLLGRHRHISHLASVVGRVHPRRGARKEVTHTRVCVTHRAHLHMQACVTHVHTGVRHTPCTLRQACVTDHTHECAYVHRSRCAHHTRAHTCPHLAVVWTT